MRTTFSMLDGLRGLVAIFVVSHHTPGYWTASLYRCYLAVDVFFLLSGFVIAHSYEAKLASAELSPARFFATRLARLYPMYAISLVVALAISADPGSDDFASAVMGAVLMKPQLDSGFLFPINVVYWSLFFELVANVLYVLVLPWLTDKRLAALVLLGGVSLVAMERSVGTMDIGMLGTPFHLAAGLVRSSFGVLFGILLYRHRHTLSARIPEMLSGWVAVTLVCLVLSTWSIGRFNWVVDAMAVTILFPVCVLAAARNVSTKSFQINRILGAASYPLYLLHLPLATLGLSLIGPLIAAYPDLSGLMLIIVCLLIALITERWLERPVRERLAALVKRPKGFKSLGSAGTIIETSRP